MRFRDKMTAKVLAAVLALLATVQPAFALYCSCDCAATAEACGQDKLDPAESCTHQHNACKSGHCHGKSKKGCCSKCPTRKNNTDEGLARKSLPIHPCQCPQGCECHLRHVIRAGIVKSADAPICLDTWSVPLDFVAANPWKPISMNTAIHRIQRPPQERSALAVCALLCHFVS
jgi:hypothetical protein